MSITTKKGDKGKTSLLFGEKVFKDDLRVEAYGTLDELCSFLGLSKSLIGDSSIKKIIKDIQRDLFMLGAEIATSPRHLNKLKKTIDASFITKLEKFISSLEGKSKFKAGCFYLPGGNTVSACLDISRTITRRAERMLVGLKRKKNIKNEYLVIYLNRLSDFLYLLARNCEKKPEKK
ncbi:MAG: cob(I)yrinic acid a,c-diamide adenosyltransferase [Candidatus Omnitrophica bacterium]|nr:cob(I)yrinic acid a,c-diamide adenosyltransferase [Candidatus Omnitrophota bacterium]